MMSIEKTSLWRSSFGSSAYSDEKEARNMLREQLLDMRRRAGLLVSLIQVDMPGLTVHDLTHLDALWETASLIAGKTYSLNPAEAFVFGGAVLLHDSAMSVAAYPGGLPEICKSPEWRDAVTNLLQLEPGGAIDPPKIDSPPESVRKAALAEVLRELHARRAAELPMIEWPLPGGGREFLIQSTETRKAYGDLIGKIAASHWWPVNDLLKLPPRVNAGPGVPVGWHVNPLKMACLLRLADAAHIDHRRAPRFLRALVGPSGVSESHWAFQERLGKPSTDKNLLVYTGGPFEVQEAEAWWLCYDLISMIDSELRSVSTLLDSRGAKPFAVTGVRAANSPETLAQLITTQGWRPVNTDLRVSDVPALVELLGGRRLYGEKLSVPVRELIQNAIDAIRARRLLGNLGSNEGRVTVRLRTQKDGHWLEVEDNGVGMSSTVLTGALLDFGKSLWRSPGIRREFPGLLAKGFKPTGRFGIGFFSVFMLGEHVTVTTRRPDAAISDMRTLDFRKGLRMRPILREPSLEEASLREGTRVSVRLGIPPGEKGGLTFDRMEGEKHISIPLSDLVARLCPAVDVAIWAEEDGKPELAVGANDWLRAEPTTILSRVADWEDRTIKFAGGHLREIGDPTTGEVHGRACIYPGRFMMDQKGVVTVGGLFACELNSLAGIFLGEAQTVDRQTGMPTAPADSLRLWATEQGRLISISKLSGKEKAIATPLVMLFGGEAPDLPIALMGHEWLTAKQVEDAVRRLPEILVHEGLEVDYDSEADGHIAPRDFENDFSVSETVFFVPSSLRSVLLVGDKHWPSCIPELYLPGRPTTCEEALRLAVKRAWGVTPDCEDDSRPVGEVNRTEITRYLTIYSRPVDMSEFQ